MLEDEGCEVLRLAGSELTNSESGGLKNLVQGGSARFVGIVVWLVGGGVHVRRSARAA